MYDIEINNNFSCFSQRNRTYTYVKQAFFQINDSFLSIFLKSWLFSLSSLKYKPRNCLGILIFEQFVKDNNEYLTNYKIIQYSAAETRYNEIVLYKTPQVLHTFSLNTKSLLVY